MRQRLCQAVVPLLLVLLSIGTPGAVGAESQSVEIIVNPGLSNVPIDRDLLRAIFTMRLRAWPNGPAVHVFVLPDNNPLSDRFYREQLGIYSYVLRSAWDRMVFTGTGLAPTVVQSEREMRERVRSTPGAIGYAGKDDAAAFRRELPEISTASTEEPQS